MCPIIPLRYNFHIWSCVKLEYGGVTVYDEVQKSFLRQDCELVSVYIFLSALIL